MIEQTELAAGQNDVRCAETENQGLLVSLNFLQKLETAAFCKVRLEKLDLHQGATQGTKYGAAFDSNCNCVLLPGKINHGVYRGLLINMFAFFIFNRLHYLLLGDGVDSVVFSLDNDQIIIVAGVIR